MWDVRRADVINWKLQGVQTRFVRREGVVGIYKVVMREWHHCNIDYSSRYLMIGIMLLRHATSFTLQIISLKFLSVVGKEA